MDRRRDRKIDQLLGRGHGRVAHSKRFANSGHDRLRPRIVGQVPADRRCHGGPVLLFSREIPHQLGQRAVGDPLAVGKAAPTEHACALAAGPAPTKARASLWVFSSMSASPAAATSSEALC
jgi:hypothetical protein